MRLNRFLAAAGLGSRRHCDELIAEGRVTVNGQPCTNFSTQIEDSDHVKVGQPTCPASGNADHRVAQAGWLRFHPARPERDRYDLRFIAAEVFPPFQRRPARRPDRGFASPHERWRPRPAPHSSALQGGERIRGHARQTLGAKARRKTAPGNFSRRQTRPTNPGAAVWPYPFAGRPPTRAEPPDPPDVLRTWLRSEAPRPHPHRPSASRRNAARQLAPPNEKRTDRACVNPVPRAGWRGAGSIRRHNSSANRSRPSACSRSPPRKVPAGPRACRPA